MRLEGKVAIITGGARGMGAVEARLFVKEGARVVIGDILEAEGGQVEAEIAEVGGEAMFVRMDVTSEDDWKATMSKTVERFGRLDILVNNAGISSRQYPDSSSVAGWDRIMDINAKGAYLGTIHAVPRMIEAGGGSIVNISSIMGLVGNPFGHAAYHASKGAVRLFTKAMAVRHAEDGIRVNSVHPGFMPPMMNQASYSEEEERLVITGTPMRRRGRQDEVANAVLFLASDEASYITGAELAVDGGYTAQ